jgi:phenolic acid decarboxylase
MEVKLMTDIDPSETVAHGAAVWAKFVQEHPDEFVGFDGTIIPDEEYYIRHEEMRRLYGPHDEL